MLLSPIKYVGFPHVWMCWHGNKNSIVVCVLNFSPLSPELHSEGSMTLPLPPPITSEEGLWMGVLRWGVVDSLMVSASTCMHMQTLCSPTSVWARPISAETFGWSSISVWNYCKIIFMLPSSSLAYDWKLYSCLHERKGAANYATRFQPVQFA